MNLTHTQAQDVEPLHTAVPGRARFKVKGLYRCEPLQEVLERELTRVQGVTHVSASPLTGNLLILWNGRATVKTIAAQIGRVLRYANHPNGTAQSVISSSAAERKARWSDISLRNGAREPSLPVGAVREPPVQPREPWHLMEPGATLAGLQASASNGLSEREARARLRAHGANTIPEAEQRSALSIALDQFNSWPVGLLAVAAGISVATGGLADALAILGVVAINATIGYVTESKSERTIQSLKSLSKPAALVVRDATLREIDARDVVVGDILVLKAGAYVPADARLIQAHHLTTDESALTGESMPVSKNPQRLFEDVTLGSRVNMVYRGTLVTGGQGIAAATAIGFATELGRIAAMATQARAPQTPMERQLATLGDQMALLCAGVCATVLGIGLLRGYGFFEMFKSSISLAVAAVPEGLPTVATTTLALGILNMRKHRVLIRRLEAVESLGCVQTICLDKTGTLTLNRMAVTGAHCGIRRVRIDGDRFFDGALEPMARAAAPGMAADRPIDPRAHDEIVKLAQACVLCSESEIARDDKQYILSGSSTENALIYMAIAAGVDVMELREQCPVLRLIPRAEHRNFMSTLHRIDPAAAAGAGPGPAQRVPAIRALGASQPLSHNARWTPQAAGPGDDSGAQSSIYLTAVKGSPADVLARCGWYLKDGQRMPLTGAERGIILSENQRMAGEALRVLGCAYGESAVAQDAGEDGLTWLGLIGMADPIRNGVREVIQGFHQAGIDTIMITGDQAPTAYAIGQDLGLSRGGPLQIVDYTHLLDNHSAQINSSAGKAHVFARISPADKLEIVQALQRAGRVVAMTGDGINDGPALKAADIGIAMGGGGTEVARDTSDVILQDDELQTMLVAISQGRTIHRNIRKSLHFLLSTNLSEIMVMFAAIAAGLGQPLSAMQLLWINLISDIFPALGLALEPPEAEVMQEPPRDPREPIVSPADLNRIAAESAVLSAGALSAYGYGLLRYGAGAHAGTLAFTTLTGSQLVHAISCRSEKHGVFTATSRPPNYFLTAALAGSFGAQALTIALPPLRTLLNLTPLSLLDATVAAGCIAAPFVINESTKRTAAAKPPVPRNLPNSSA